MKRKIVILPLLISFSIFSGCGGVFEPGYIDKGPPTALQAYKKPGATIEDVKQALKQCSYELLDSHLPLEYLTNERLRVKFCMYDKGFKLNSPNTTRDSCIQIYKYHGFKPPVCVARGVFN